MLNLSDAVAALGVAWVNLLGPAVWAAALLLCFVGWGRIARRALYRDQGGTWEEHGVVGMAVLIFFGGIVNCLSIVSRPLVIGLVLFGAVAGIAPVVARVRRWRAERSWAVPAEWTGPALAVAKPALLFLVTTLYATGFDAFAGGFNGHDDAQAYLAFPQQMLQTGGMVLDPFNERRMSSAFGGQSFLHVLVLAVLRVENLKLLDPGVGVVFTVGLVASYLRRHGRGWLTVAAVALGPLLLPYSVVNLSSVTTTVALMLGTPLILSRWAARETPLPNAALTALLSGAIFSLKSTNVVWAGAFLVALYLPQLFRRHRRLPGLREGALSFVCLIVVLLPWMIALYRTAGTLLYPVLGKGYSGTTHDAVGLGRDLPFDAQRVLRVLAWPRGVLVVLLLLLLAWNARSFWISLRRRPLVLAACFASVADALVLEITLPFYPRYQTPALYVAFFLAILGVLKLPIRKATGRAAAAVAVGCVLLSLWAVAREVSHQFVVRFQQLDGALFERPTMMSDQPLYRNAQGAAEAGARILVRVDRPYLLDYARNTIWTADFPCGASLPPGMPCERGADALVAYLRQVGVSYVLFSYAGEANYSRAGFGHYLLPGVDPWTAEQARRVFLFNDLLAELGKRYPHVYDDGQRWLVRLSSPTERSDGRSATPDDSAGAPNSP